MNSTMWQTAVESINKAADVALFSIRQLLITFNPGSESFDGDIGEVKVAARKDCTAADCERLKQLAQQVFLLDSQRPDVYVSHPTEGPDGEERSFIFLLYPPGIEKTLNPDLFIIRVAYRNLIVGILAHHILLQTIGAMLLQGCSYVVPSLANIMLQSTTSSDMYAKLPTGSTHHLPGLLCYMEHTQIQQLFQSLISSYELSVEFDARPGLKFLLQKVAGLDTAANLYKQAGAAWTIQIVTLFTLAIHEIQKNGFNAKQVKESLESKQIKEDGICYIILLQECFKAQCDLYVDLVVDRDGHCSATDRLADQPLFFLVAEPNDFPEIQLTETIEKQEEVSENALNQISRQEDKIIEKDVTSHYAAAAVNDNLTAKSEDISDASSSPIKYGNDTIQYMCSDGHVTKPRRPFQLSDFARSSLDSEESLELPEELRDPSPLPHHQSADETVATTEAVYNIATKRNITDMITEFRKRKQQFSMPLHHRERIHSNDDNRDEYNGSILSDIKNQQRNSFMKDSEAHLQVWTEMILSVFDLTAQLEDSHFQTLLPALFPGIRSLTAFASNPGLKQVIAELFQRVATVYGFGPE